MENKPILTNKYIPTKARDKYEWDEHVLMTYFDDLKYRQFASNTDDYFRLACIVNFDIINHKYCGDPLQNPEVYYQTIRKKGL